MIATQHTSRRVGECVVRYGRKSKDSRAAPESPYALSHVWWEQEKPRVGQCCSEGHKPGWDRERRGQAEGPTFRFMDWLPGSWSVHWPHAFLTLSALSPYHVQMCTHTRTHARSSFFTLIRKHWNSAQTHSTQMFIEAIIHFKWHF